MESLCVVNCDGRRAGPAQRASAARPAGLITPPASMPGTLPVAAADGRRRSSRAPAAHRRPPERLQLQSVNVDALPEFGVRRIEYLESTVAGEPVDDIGPDPSADIVGSLPDAHLATGRSEDAGTSQPGQARPDHQDLCLFDIHCCSAIHARRPGRRTLIQQDVPHGFSIDLAGPVRHQRYRTNPAGPPDPRAHHLRRRVGRGSRSARRCRSRALAMRRPPSASILEHMAETSDLVSETALDPIGAVLRTQVGREATEPMREDIRLLGAMLGDTVREQNGDEVFDLVERARVESFRVRRSEIDRAELAQLFDGIDVRKAIPVIRAFTHFALLANVAEDIHRERRRAVHVAAGEPPQNSSLAATYLEAGRRGPGRRHGGRRADRCARVAGRSPRIRPRRVGAPSSTPSTGSPS